MNRINSITFNAQFIENVEINEKIASNCDLRSKFVHEIIYRNRMTDAEYSVILLISEKGLRIMRSVDQVILVSHSMSRISYSACDRINHLFALVMRSSEVGREQICRVFRMESSEQADSINRYFGNIFKHLHNIKEQKKSKVALLNNEKYKKNTQKNERVEQVIFSLDINKQESDSGNSLEEVMDSRLKQISNSNIEDLVNEKHYLRRLSLCVTSNEVQDIDIYDQESLPQQSITQTKTSSINNCAQPILRRKKPEYKGNRISAVIERLSFRGSKEISTDVLKSGSPVVALKEQLEYEERLSANNSIGSEKHQHQVARPPNHKPFPSSNSNLHINNDSQPTNNNVIPILVRKNSAPMCNDLEEEHPPVPPVRINSLRTKSFPKTLNIGDSFQNSRGFGEGASQSMPENSDEDDHLSSITTPSSCGHEDSDPFRVYNEPPPPAIAYRESTSQKNCTPSLRETVSFPTQIDAHSQSCSSNVPIQYFKDFSKEESMQFLLEKEVGSFLLRDSASHYGCMALSVKVAENLVSHYIVQQTSIGFQMKGLEKTWPSLQSLITHLSVIPEMLPCPIRISQPCHPNEPRKTPAPASYFTAASDRRLPQSRSADDEYEQRMRHFLCGLSPVSAAKDQYQQLSDFSSIVAGHDCF